MDNFDEHTVPDFPVSNRFSGINRKFGFFLCYIYTDTLLETRGDIPTENSYACFPLSSRVLQGCNCRVILSHYFFSEKTIETRRLRLINHPAQIIVGVECYYYHRVIRAANGTLCTHGYWRNRRCLPPPSHCSASHIRYLYHEIHSIILSQIWGDSFVDYGSF